MKALDSRAWIALALLGGLALPAVIYPVLAMKIACFMLFACAFNLLLGYTGLLSFGHAAFFGGAGYIAAWLLKVQQWPTAFGVLGGVAFAAVLGAVFGGLAIRRQGIYLTMITMALAQMLFFVFLQAPFTGGEDGLQGVPRGTLLGLDLDSDLVLYYVMLAVFVAALWLIARIVDSPFGQILRAIKENEARAISLGYDVARFKLLAFILSAALAGLAGAMKALLLGFATLTDVHWVLSGTVVLMTLVGGMGTLAGPAVGALVVVVIEDRLGDLGEWLAGFTGLDGFRILGESASTVTGIIFVVCVLAFRRGIVGTLWQRR